MGGLNIDIHNEVYLTKWNKEWARSFHLEKQGIIGSMIAEGHNGAVYHVGSTSIEGMIARPIIDILVCPEDDVPLEDVIPELERIGYKNLGDGGMLDSFFLTRGDKPHGAFCVHLCHEGNQVTLDQLLFQKVERTNPVICRKYVRLKTLLWDLFPDDCATYSALKGLFIEGVLSAYRQASGENTEKGDNA